MFQLQEIKRLEERRRVLVAESERLRRQAAGDLSVLDETIGRVRRGCAAFETLGSWWPAVAAVAGVFVARKNSGWFATLKKVWSWWQLSQKLAGLWRASATPPSNEDR